MNSESTKTLKVQTEYFEQSNNPEDCIASRASTEIMIDRFCNGNEIDFPFTK